jgi:hypothetical protein
MLDYVIGKQARMTEWKNGRKAGKPNGSEKAGKK